MFISSMVLQWIMTFCTYQQKLKTCMKPQFQWEKCCTHVWPSMEDVNLSFFCADKLRVYPRWHWYFHWWNTLKERQKHCKIQCKINILQIHTNKLQLASGEPPAFALYIYIYIYIYICTCDQPWFYWQLSQFVAGDCWLLCAISCVAEFPNFFKDHLFVTQEPSFSENHWWKSPNPKIHDWDCWEYI